MAARTTAARTLITFFLLLLLLPADASRGQVIASERQGFIYDFARPGRPTITVYVWGAVGQPGIWRINPGTTLIELLSAAGIPGIVTEQRRTRLTTIVRIWRGEQVQRNLVYEAQLQDLLTEEQETYPTLRNGDILEIEVDEDRKITFRTVIEYLSAAASLTLLALRLLRYN